MAVPASGLLLTPFPPGFLPWQSYFCFAAVSTAVEMANLNVLIANRCTEIEAIRAKLSAPGGSSP